MAKRDDATIGWIVFGIIGIAALAFIVQKVQEFFNKNPWAGWLLFSIIIIIGILFITYLVLKVSGRR